MYTTERALRAALPPGPRYPAVIQMIGFWKRPLAFLEQCRARYGKRFTLRFPFAPPFVIISDPDEIKQAFTAPPDVLHPGEGARVLEVLFEGTRAVGLFLESVRRPEAFTQALGMLAEAGKPVACLKVGRSAGGAKAVLAHSGAVVGSDVAFGALLRAYGVIQVDDYAELIEVLEVLGRKRRPPGTRRWRSRGARDSA